MSKTIARLQHRIWVLAYGLEESRSIHAAQRHYLREAACCLALMALRLLDQ